MSCSLPDNLLENLQFLLLRNILLALKYSRDENYLRQHWQKIIIFAPELRAGNSHLELLQATVIYISRISNVFNEKIADMDSALSSSESYVVKPYVIKLYEDGLAKGIEKGVEKGFAKAILTFLKKNPDWTDQQVAQMFEVTEDLVKKLRASPK